MVFNHKTARWLSLGRQLLGAHAAPLVVKLGVWKKALNSGSLAKGLRFMHFIFLMEAAKYTKNPSHVKMGRCLRSRPASIFREGEWWPRGGLSSRKLSGAGGQTCRAHLQGTGREQENAEPDDRM